MGTIAGYIGPADQEAAKKEEATVFPEESKYLIIIYLPRTCHYPKLKYLFLRPQGSKYTNDTYIGPESL